MSGPYATRGRAGLIAWIAFGIAVALSPLTAAEARECTSAEIRVGICTGDASARFAGGFVSGSDFVTSWQARELLIRIACPANTQATKRAGDFSFCTGVLTVSYQGRAIAGIPFSIRTFDSHVEKVTVGRGARRLFAPGRRVQVRWRARSHDGRGRWATRSGVVTVHNPYDRL